VHLSRLQDVINSLKKEISETEKSIEIESARLTEEVTRLQHNIVQIDNKADHFAEMNDRKYQQVWGLNRATAKKLLDKVIIIMFSMRILSQL
jgi:dynein regulatory complex protein 1